MTRLIAACLIPVLLFSQAAGEMSDASVHKQQIVERGVGGRVSLVLKDHSHVKGVILQIGEENFKLRPRNAPDVRVISYTELAAVHSDKMRAGTKVLIGVGVFVGVMAVFLAFVAHELRKS